MDWHTDSPQNTPTNKHNTHTSMRNMKDFLSEPDPGGMEFTYGSATAIGAAKQYAANELNVGAQVLRKLVKTVEMMMDPDMEDHLAGAL